MSRKFLRPLFSFWDPLFSENVVSKKAIPGGSKAYKAYNKKEEKTHDPHETFDNFFKDYYQNSQGLRKEEKDFFQKHYPQRVGKKFNPYQALGVDKNSDLEKIKQAYRANALKYHPKNDNSQDAQRKFNDLARAYNEIISQKRTDDYGQDVSSKSLFEDFHNQMEKIEQNQVEQDSKNQNNTLNVQQQNQKQKDDGKLKDQNKYNSKAEQNKDQSKSAKKQHKEEKNAKQQNKKDKKESQINTKSNESAQQAQKNYKNPALKGAQLYSQSSYFEFIDGKRKLHVTKMYQKNGRTIRVDRIQDHRHDGTIQVTETLDDGREVKNKKFIQEGSKKKKQIGQ